MSFVKFHLSQLVLFIMLFGTVSIAQTETKKNQDIDIFSSFKYRCVGPTRGGRVTTVAGITSNPNVYYMGTTGGGLWKTEDYGISWNNISDGFFNTPSIGAIAVSQNNPNILYVGTGSDGLRSNVITGKGLYKSTDAGKEWKSIGLLGTGQIGAVEIHPENGNIVFVAAIGQAFQPNAERGVYRTTDGGVSWNLVLHHSDTVGAVDIEFAPNNPEIVYATLWRAERKPWTIISGSTEGGIYKSIDGGTTWNKLSNGLPQGLIGKIDLAVSAAEPDRLYALIEAPEGEGGLYQSDDKGNSFQLVSTNRGLLNRPFYYCNVEANPQNANSLFVMAQGFFRSTDGGKNWKRERTPHGDNHDIWINKKDTSIFIQSNDGGANVTTNNGKTWSSQHNQPTAELYQVEVDGQYPYWLYAGQQDNSTIAVPSKPPYSAIGGNGSYWLEVGGCETGPAVPKPGNADIVYSNCKGHFSVHNKRTGQSRQYSVSATNIYSHNPKDLEFRFQRVSPIHVSPHNPDVVYHASQYVHKTTNDGLSWEIISPDLTAFEPDKQVISGSPITRDITGEEYYSTIYSLRESPVAEGLIWSGANDGPVYVTEDGGKNWKNVTPESLPKGGRVDCVEPSPHQKGKAYIAVLRYQLGDWHPYIYRTDDFGKKWTLLTTGKNGIPADYPTRVVREDTDREGLLYAGTEFGMFVSFNDGKDWMPFQQNLPVTPVTDIKVFRKDLVISTMGRSFWIMDNVSTLHQIKDISKIKADKLFKPRDSYRLSYRGNGSKSVPHYPEPAATINYNLSKIPSKGLEMDIINANNEVVASFKSKEVKEKKDLESEDAMDFFYRRRRSEQVLSQKAGINQFAWDMRHKGVIGKNGKSTRPGPLVSPGDYKIKLWINGKEYIETIKIFPDPRVIQNGVSVEYMKIQEKFALKVRGLEQSASKLLQEVNQNIEKLTDSEGTGQDNLKQQLKSIEQLLVTKKGTYEQPMLMDQIRSLSSMINRADQLPGTVFYSRFDKLKLQLDAIRTTFKQLKQK